MLSVPPWARGGFSVDYYSKPVGKVKEGKSGRGRCESAGQNRHGVGGESPLQSKGKQPALASSYASTTSDGRGPAEAGLADEVIGILFVLYLRKLLPGISRQLPQLLHYWKCWFFL